LRIDPALDIAAAGGLAVMGAVAVLYFAVQRRDRAPLWLGLFNAALADALRAGVPGHRRPRGACLPRPLRPVHVSEGVPPFGTRAIVAAALAAAAMSVLPGLLPPQAAAAITIAGAAWLAWIVAKAALARPKPWPALLLGMPVLLPLLTLEMFRGFAPGG
jgi:hypothetical protein